MGAVYRATGVKLNRDGEAKILPDAFADDPDRLARFARGAQVLASNESSEHRRDLRRRRKDKQ
jgi:serine/threonine-protein kinase